MSGPTHIPGLWSISELAAALGVERHMIWYRVRTGMIAAHKLGNRPKSKLFISSGQLRRDYPAIWDALLERQPMLEAGDKGG